MYIRLLKKEEYPAADLVQAVAFEWDWQDPSLKKEKEEENTEKQILPLKRWAAFEEKGNTPFACIDVKEYAVRFDGTVQKMGGIGGVSTLPPFRKSGAIRGCMGAALEDMYENGFGFAFLYPFSRTYYRQFGFEDGPLTHTWTIRLDGLPRGDSKGSVELLLPGSDLSPLTDIYNRFYDACNLSVVRKEYDPDFHIAEHVSRHRFVFLWRNDAGEPRGFVILKKKDGTVMDCRTDFGQPNAFIALDAEAYINLFRYIRTVYFANYQSLRLTVPDYIPLGYLLPEGNWAECTQGLNGMVRVVSVERVLKACRCLGKGKLRIGIKDTMVPQNAGVWNLEFEEGKENRVTKCQEEPDVQMPIHIFSALICGIRSARDLPYMPEVSVVHEQAPLDSVFYKKPCHVLDLF